MKKIFFCSFLLIFLVITAKAQYVPMQSYQYKGLAMDTLYIPTGCGMPAYTPNSYNRGAFFYDTCNFVFYKFDPTSNLWGYIGVDTITKINDSVIRVYESYTAGDYYELQINGNGAGGGGVSGSAGGDLTGTYPDPNVVWANGYSTYDVRYLPEFTPGYVTWSGTGLTFDVTAASYTIDGTRYSSDAGSITLDAADATDPRYDVIAIDNTGTIVKITGTAAATPSVPQVDPATQIALTTIRIDAGATTPSEITQELIYDENAENWTGTNTGVTVDFDNTSTVYHSSKSADVGSWTNGNQINFTKNTGTTNASDYSIIKMYINLKSSIAGTGNVRVSFLNGTTVVSNVVTLSTAHGFTKAVSGSYQNISIPISAFTFTSTTFNKIRITLAGTGGGMYLDYVQLQSGVTTTVANESDPIAINKTVSVSPDYGLLIPESVTQQLNTNPSFTPRIDTFNIATRDRLNKVADSILSLGGTTDETAYHTITQLNDSAYTLNRPNGTKDTIQISGTGNTATPGGNNESIQFNDGGNFGGVDSFTYDKTNKIVTIYNSDIGSNVLPNATETSILAINNTPATSTQTKQYGPIISSTGSAWKANATAASQYGSAGFRAIPQNGTGGTTPRMEFLIGTNSNVPNGSIGYWDLGGLVSNGGFQAGTSGTGSVSAGNLTSVSSLIIQSAKTSDLKIQSGGNANIIDHANTQDIGFWAAQAQSGTTDQNIAFFFARPASFGLGTATNTAGGTTVTGGGTRFTEQFSVGDQINIVTNGTPEIQTITAITDDQHMTTTAWTNAHTNGSFKFVGTLNLFGIKANGQIGTSSVTPTSWFDLHPSTAEHATMKITSGTTPTSPNNGDMWFDGTHLYIEIGGVSKQLDN